jgi:ABC-type multidrug transport system fused ATPase/permease subunit
VLWSVSTARIADLIVVLDGARLVEVGTHDELMAKSGPYSELHGHPSRRVPLSISWSSYVMR